MGFIKDLDKNKRIFASNSNVVLFDPIEDNTLDLNSVVADTLEWTSEESDDFDDVPQTPNGVYSFSLNCGSDLSNFQDFLMGEPTDEQTREMSVVIHGANSKPEIYRPHNLKYPNKKRAKRIKRKWFNRYGANFGQPIIIPKCQISFDADGYHLTALEAPRPRNTRKLIFGF